MPPESPPKSDADEAALASAIGDDPVSDAAPPQPQPAPKEDKPGDGPPETPEEKETREKAEVEAKLEEAEKGDKGKPKDEDQPPEDDPLKGLELKALLEHPVLGRKLQHWSDTAGNLRIRHAVDAERSSITATAERTAEEKQSDAHFASMTKEQIAEEISDNKDAALAYAQYETRLKANAGGGLNPEAVARSSEVFAVTAQVRLNTEMLEKSELSPEVKEGLKPENYNKPGDEGLTAWGEAIFTALVTQEAQSLAEKLKEEQWDAYKQEHLAEIDGERPNATGGRRASPVPDLITTPTDELWAEAFVDRPLDKQQKGD